MRIFSANPQHPKFMQTRIVSNENIATDESGRDEKEPWGDAGRGQTGVRQFEKENILCEVTGQRLILLEGRGQINASVNVHEAFEMRVAVGDDAGAA